jgi:hypothetical protein
MSRAVNRGGGALMTSNSSYERITSKASIDFSSLTTISRAIRIGKRFLIARDAWAIYYTPSHIETILRRAQAYDINIWRLTQIILWFARSLTIEKVHPLQGGFVRLKNRHERRPRNIRQAAAATRACLTMTSQINCG